jgi:hypothetical protein
VGEGRVRTEGRPVEAADWGREQLSLSLSLSSRARSLARALSLSLSRARSLSPLRHSSPLSPLVPAFSAPCFTSL